MRLQTPTNPHRPHLDRGDGHPIRSHRSALVNCKRSPAPRVLFRHKARNNTATDTRRSETKLETDAHAHILPFDACSVNDRCITCNLVRQYAPKIGRAHV